MKCSIIMVESNLGYQFNNESLLMKALTHPSANIPLNNKELETLGDIILSVLHIRKLSSSYAKLNNAQMTRKLSELENNQVLQEYIKKLGLEEKVKLGHSVCGNKATKNKALSQTFEAIVAAIFIDCDFNWEILEKWFRTTCT